MALIDLTGETTTNEISHTLSRNLKSKSNCLSAPVVAFQSPAIFQRCFLFQPGDRYVDYYDGDRGISCGHMTLVKLKKKYESLQVRITKESLEHLARRGDLENLEWLLRSEHWTCPSKVLELAAGEGHLNMVRALAAEGAEPAARAMNAAARAGRLRVVRWLHDNSTAGCTAKAMDWAAMNNHIQVVEFLHSSRDEGGTYRGGYAAAYRGHLQMVEWLVNNRPDEIGPDILDRAAEGGSTGCVRWLWRRRRGCGGGGGGAAAAARPAGGAVDLAAANGHLGTLEALHALAAAPPLATTGDNGGGGGGGGGHPVIINLVSNQKDESLPATKSAMDGAAGNGHLKVVEWLFDHRLEGCSFDALDRAAAGGFLHVCKFLHGYCSQNIIREDSKALDLALSNGHTETCRWFHSNSLITKCSAQAVFRAALNGHLNTLKWAIQHQLWRTTLDASDDDDFYAVAAEKAASRRHFDVARLFLSQKKSKTGNIPAKIVESMALAGNLSEIQKTSPEQQKSLARLCVQAASRNGHIQILKYFIEERRCLQKTQPEDNAVSVQLELQPLDQAAAQGHFAVLEYLHQFKLAKFTSQALVGAARNNHLATAALLCSTFKPIDNENWDFSKSITVASENGHLSMVKFLMSRCPPSACLKIPARAMDLAAQNDHLDVMIYLSDQGSSFTKRALGYSACKGHFAILRWLLQKQNFTEETSLAMDQAARNGHIRILKYLKRKTDQRFSSNALYSSIANGHKHILRFLLRDKHPNGQPILDFEYAVVSRLLVLHEQSHLSSWLKQHLFVVDNNDNIM